MQEKAEASSSSTRKDEMEAAHAFALLKQGLEDEIKVAKKQLSQATNYLEFGTGGSRWGATLAGGRGGDPGGR